MVIFHTQMLHVWNIYIHLPIFTYIFHTWSIWVIWDSKLLVYQNLHETFTISANTTNLIGACSPSWKIFSGVIIPKIVFRTLVCNPFPPI